MSFSAGDGVLFGNSGWYAVRASKQCFKPDERFKGARNIAALFSPNPGVTFEVTKAQKLDGKSDEVITVVSTLPLPF